MFDRTLKIAPSILAADFANFGAWVRATNFNFYAFSGCFTN